MPNGSNGFRRRRTARQWGTHSATAAVHTAGRFHAPANPAFVRWPPFALCTAAKTSWTTSSVSRDTSQIPQREEPRHEPRPTGKRRLLVPILVLTGVLAVAGAVLLAKFLRGPSPTLPPLVQGPDFNNVTCDQGYAQPSETGFGSRSGRGTGDTSCEFAQHILNAYWSQYGRATRERLRRGVPSSAYLTIACNVMARISSCSARGALQAIGSAAPGAITRASICSSGHQILPRP
jgi:hypothetical protein